MDSERAAFEKWCGDYELAEYVGREWNRRWSDDSGYANLYVEYAYNAWQAARAALKGDGAGEKTMSKPCDTLNTTCEEYPCCPCGRAARNLPTPAPLAGAETFGLDEPRPEIDAPAVANDATVKESLTVPTVTLRERTDEARDAYHQGYAAGQLAMREAAVRVCGTVYGPWDVDLDPAENTRRITAVCADAIAAIPVSGGSK